jgi:hypothetical protein
LNFGMESVAPARGGYIYSRRSLAPDRPFTVHSFF